MVRFPAGCARVLLAGATTLVDGRLGVEFFVQGREAVEEQLGEQARASGSKRIQRRVDTRFPRKRLTEEAEVKSSMAARSSAATAWSPQDPSRSWSSPETPASKGCYLGTLKSRGKQMITPFAYLWKTAR